MVPNQTIDEKEFDSKMGCRLRDPFYQGAKRTMVMWPKLPPSSTNNQTSQIAPRWLRLQSKEILVNKWRAWQKEVGSAGLERLETTANQKERSLAAASNALTCHNQAMQHTSQEFFQAQQVGGVTAEHRPDRHQQARRSPRVLRGLLCNTQLGGHHHRKC